jgi:hypothetical protein
VHAVRGGHVQGRDGIRTVHELSRGNVLELSRTRMQCMPKFVLFRARVYVNYKLLL